MTRTDPPLAGDERSTLVAFLDHHREIAGSDRTIREASSLDQLSQRTGRAGRPTSLRWIIVHMVREYARHNGHADLIRESIDGVTGQ